MNSSAAIRVNVQPLNPGQFFACCGLFELADRLWPGAEACFTANDNQFEIACAGDLPTLLKALTEAELTLRDVDDPYSSPLILGAPFRRLQLDWWELPLFGARDLIVWAGTMESHGIAYAMQQALRDGKFQMPDLFDVGMVVREPSDPSKKKEPYYFDGRRATNAHSRDTGFSANDLSLESVAHPAVELLCLIGLQVARPCLTSASRIYHYFSWSQPIPTNLLLAVSSGLVELPGRRGYRFENWFRTGQKKHKAFRMATLLKIGGN